MSDGDVEVLYIIFVRRRWAASGRKVNTLSIRGFPPSLPFPSRSSSLVPPGRRRLFSPSASSHKNTVRRRVYPSAAAAAVLLRPTVQPPRASVLSLRRVVPINKNHDRVTRVRARGAGRGGLARASYRSIDRRQRRRRKMATAGALSRRHRAIRPRTPRYRSSTSLADGRVPPLTPARFCVLATRLCGTNRKRRFPVRCVLTEEKQSKKK